MWKFLDGVSEPAAKKAKTKEETLQVQRVYDKDKRKRSFQPQCMEGAQIGEFDPDPAIQQWESASVRARRPFFNDSEKPKAKYLSSEAEVESEPAEDAEEVHFEDLVKETESASLSSDDEEENLFRRDIHALQQKAYKMLLDLM